MSEYPTDHFFNRELSWLQFNTRVLAEGENPEVPLLERLKFLAIVSSNLDEFFMVRVALMHRAHEAKEGPAGPDGLTPAQTLDGISEVAHEMVARQYACFDKEVRPALAKEKIEILRSKHLSDEEKTYLEQYYLDEVQPTLTPMAIDTGHPFPLLANLSTYILFKVKAQDNVTRRYFSQADTVLLQVPPGLRRFILLPGPKNSYRFALLDDVICLFANKLLGGYDIEGAHAFRVTRDAEFTVDEERVDDLMSAIEQELRSRRRGKPLRLEVGTHVPEETVAYLRNQLELEDSSIYRIPTLIDLKSLFGLLGSIDRPDLCDTAWPPVPHPRLEESDSIFRVIRGGDVILHHPYQSFDPVVRLISQAADDHEVLAIKITLYRVSGDSPLVKALVRAAESGKQVTALVELRARFDEEANITWARRLDAAGAHIIYGVVGYKTHSKVALVVRREPDGIRRYVHLGTGNYNDKTARLYTDVGLFTARPEYGIDVSAFFNVITGYSLPPAWNRIEMAPTGMRDRILYLIQREIEKHSPETPGFIRAKLNSLVDPKVIEALYKASQAGVRVDLVVRGLCRLRPGLKKLSENIRVISVIDRFLEHPRIIHVHNGGQEEVYCASADWMERNFDRRLELIFPIPDPKLRKLVLKILDAALEDNVKAWTLAADGSYTRIQPKRGEKPRRSQQVLYDAAVRLYKQSKQGKKKGTFIAKTSPDNRRGRNG